METYQLSFLCFVYYIFIFGLTHPLSIYMNCAEIFLTTSIIVCCYIRSLSSASLSSSQSMLHNLHKSYSDYFKEHGECNLKTVTQQQHCCSDSFNMRAKQQRLFFVHCSLQVNKNTVKLLFSCRWTTCVGFQYVVYKTGRDIYSAVGLVLLQAAVQLVTTDVCPDGGLVKMRFGGLARKEGEIELDR